MLFEVKLLKVQWTSRCHKLSKTLNTLHAHSGINLCMWPQDKVPLWREKRREDKRQKLCYDNKSLPMVWHSGTRCENVCNSSSQTNKVFFIWIAEIYYDGGEFTFKNVMFICVFLTMQEWLETIVMCIPYHRLIITNKQLMHWVDTCTPSFYLFASPPQEQKGKVCRMASWNLNHINLYLQSVSKYCKENLMFISLCKHLRCVFRIYLTSHSVSEPIKSRTHFLRIAIGWKDNNKTYLLALSKVSQGCKSTCDPLEERTKALSDEPLIKVLVRSPQS